MISFKELLSGHSLADVPIEHQHNLEELLTRINKVRTARNIPMIPTSGYRSMQDHLRIYSQMGITDRSKIPMNSRHLTGQAVDISDPDGKLYEWCEKNETLLAEIGLWMEVKDKYKRVHFQTEPPRSGKRFFNP